MAKGGKKLFGGKRKTLLIVGGAAVVGIILWRTGMLSRITSKLHGIGGGMSGPPPPPPGVVAKGHLAFSRGPYTQHVVPGAY